MAIDPKFIGRSYGPYVYEAGAAKMREFAFAISGGVPSHGFTGSGAPEGLNPLLWDSAAAKAGPYGALVGFPTFPVAFAIAPFGQAVADPELGINLLLLVHGEQEFEFFEVIRPGDVLTTTGVITDIFHKAKKDFVIVTTETKNQHGRPVVKGTWTAVIRG
jgi:acyl dehydratase